MRTNLGTWNQETVDRLEAMWRSGCSGSKIAGELGISRSAVLGKLYRLGLMRQTRPPQQRARPASTAPRAPRSKPSAPKLIVVPPAPAPIVPFTAPVCEPVLFWDRSSTECAWIVDTGPRGAGAARCCGAPVMIGSYCGWHHERSLARSA